MTQSSSCAEVTAVVSALEGHRDFLLAAQSFYAQDIVWVAPARGIRVAGREAVIAHQLREAASMWNPEFTFLRRSNNDRQIIDEFAVRFVCTGSTIESAPVRSGDLVELKRLRILDVQSGRVVHETCIENWTVLETVEG